MSRLPFVPFEIKSNEYFDLIYSDVWGPVPIVGNYRRKYFVTFIDDKSRAT